MNAASRYFWHAAVIMLFGIAAARAEMLTTQDYVEIEQLYARYNHAIDSGDALGWAATFITGQYTDVLVKTAEGWRFKSRRVINDAARTKS